MAWVIFFVRESRPDLAPNPAAFEQLSPAFPGRTAWRTAARLRAWQVVFLADGAGMRWCTRAGELRRPLRRVKHESLRRAAG